MRHVWNFVPYGATWDGTPQRPKSSWLRCAMVPGCPWLWLWHLERLWLPHPPLLRAKAERCDTILSRQQCCLLGETALPLCSRTLRGSCSPNSQHQAGVAAHTLLRGLVWGHEK